MTTADREPSTLAVIRLVAGRELGERLRAKSFYILTGLLVLLIVAMGVGSRFIDDDGPSTIAVGVTGPQSEQLTSAIEATAAGIDRTAEVQTFADGASAGESLSDGDVDVVVDQDELSVVFADDVDDQVLAIVQQAWAGVEIEQNLRDAGLDDEQVGSALTPRSLEARSLAGDDDDDGLAVLTGTMSAILLFVSLQTFGGYVLTGVVEEKSTAVVELLLARVRADQLLAGKVIGIGIAALLQFVAAVVASLVSLAISGTDVPGAVWSAVPLTLVWFLTGYAFYSMLFALAGSLVSRQEDAQAASAPILTALIAAYMLVFVFGYIPDSMPSRIMSVIPPIAPLLMPLRMAAGEAAAYEVAAALVFLLASIWGVWKLTGRIYDQVLLRRGSRISWRDAWSLASSRA
jgi:ABC-2 type transport system permease protein